MNEQPDSELYAELAALRQRLSHLEAEHEEVQRQAARAHRPAFLRKFLLGPLPVALLVVGGGLLYAQGDALFIDQAGDVSIVKKLNVTGDVTTKGKLEAASAKVTGPLTTGSLITTGDVGIGATPPSHKFHVVAADAVGLFESSGGQAYLRLSTNEGLGNRVEITNRPGGRLSLWTAGGGDVFNITKDGKVGIGTDKPNAKLEVKGNARIDGGVSSMAVYQIDQDDPPKTYEISPRYHLSVMAERFDGTTIPIPKQTLTDLCGDQDGCQVRLGMTRWDSNSKTETASRTFQFYYSPNDGHWRSNHVHDDWAGVIGNGKREDAMNIWNTCYFTDGTFVNKGDKGDTKAGMALLVWDGNKNPKRTCELTLID
ncbi:MAG: hypothetical protein P0120_00705 [Nitrospira sp.]|nr:hypothetical protein [Nitrospira sp.]